MTVEDDPFNNYIVRPNKRIHYIHQLGMIKKCQKSKPGNLPTPKITSMVKQISPATPNINEYGSSLIPTLILSLKLYDLIYFITSFSYFSKANRTAFFKNYYFCYGNTFWMLGEIKEYALPDMP